MSYIYAALSHAERFSFYNSCVTFFKLFWLSLKAHKMIWLFVLFYILISRVTISSFTNDVPTPFYEILYTFFRFGLIFYAMGIIVERFFNMVFFEKPERPLKAFLPSFKSFFMCPQRLANGLPILIATFITMKHFGQIKAVISQINPFSWDKTFMQLDRAMHFGIDPWVIMHPFLGYFPVTIVIDWIYLFWIFIIYGVWMSAAFAKEHSVLRTQFLMAFLLIWTVVGNGFAIMLSSVGPIFYGDIGLEPNPFIELTDYLSQVDSQFSLMALKIKEILWTSYTGGETMVKGISAMPSMHNCSAILVAIYAWHVDKAFGKALTVFAAIIFLGSIHLGWHYAIDAYLAGILAFLFWWVAGKIAIWMHTLSDSKKYDAFKQKMN